MASITLPERCDRGTVQALLPELVALAGTRTMTRSRQTEEQFESAAPPASEESAVCAQAPLLVKT